MANNEYINKVEYGDDTLIDLTNDTVTEDTLIAGYTAHTRSGAIVTGTLGDATTSTHGLMSAADKTKLDGIGIATNQNLGLVKPQGMGISVNSTNGEIYIDKSDLANIKAGINDYAPIVASNQHEAIFYGLAKAAGDTTQYLNSSAVGTYTSDAKTAIKSMLGVTEVPAVTSSDNGKVLRVVNGTWSAVSLPSASGVSF